MCRQGSFSFSQLFVVITFRELDSPFQVQEVKTSSALNKFLQRLVNKVLFGPGPAQFEGFLDKMIIQRVKHRGQSDRPVASKQKARTQPSGTKLRAPRTQNLEPRTQHPDRFFAFLGITYQL
jgi:hypothetical protein